MVSSTVADTIAPCGHSPRKLHLFILTCTTLLETHRIWKAVVDVPYNLQRVVINLQRVVDINATRCSVSDLQLVVGRPSVIND